MKKKKRMCYYCKFAGEPFKIHGKTNLHCEHPKWDKRKGEKNFSPFETLMEFWEVCDDFQDKKE